MLLAELGGTLDVAEVAKAKAGMALCGGESCDAGGEGYESVGDMG